MTGTHQMLLGDFDLADNDGDGWSVQMLAEGATWGNALPVTTVVRNLFGDGSQVDVDGDDNREVTFDVVIKATDSAALADGEVAFLAETRKRNTLTWVPPDGYAYPTVFVVVWSITNHTHSDWDELRTERRFNLTLTCEPFPRSETETVTAALSSPGGSAPTEATVDSGSATTNWTATDTSNFSNASLSVVSGAVRCTMSAAVSLVPWTRMLTRTATVDTSVMGYLTLNVRSSTSDPITVDLDGAPASKLLDSLTVPSAGVYARTIVVAAPGASVGIIKVTQSLLATSSTAGYVEVDSITQSDQPPTLGTTRQLTRTLTVGGSAPTSGSLEVTHDTDALGTVLVATYPQHDGYSPALRGAFLSGNAVTPDASLVSGAYHSILTTPTVYELPVSAIPSGTHLLLPRLKASVTGVATLVWAAQIYIDGDAVGVGTGIASRVSLTADEWTIGGPLQVQLEPTRVPDDSTATIRLTLLGSVTSGTLLVDEAWCIWRRDEQGRPVGGLTIVECGDGTAAAGGPSKQLYIDGPTDTLPIPTLYRAHDSRADGWFPAMDWTSFDHHTFRPGTMTVFSVTTNAENAAVALRHYERWIHHAAA